MPRRALRQRLIHADGTIEFGHYTAYARSRDDARWRLFNDATVAPVADEDVSKPSRAAYILFLLREDVARSRPRPTATR